MFLTAEPSPQPSSSLKAKGRKQNLTGNHLERQMTYDDMCYQHSFIAPGQRRVYDLQGPEATAQSLMIDAIKKVSAWSRYRKAGRESDYRKRPKRPLHMTHYPTVSQNYTTTLDPQLL